MGGLCALQYRTKKKVLAQARFLLSWERVGSTLISVQRLPNFLFSSKCQPGFLVTLFFTRHCRRRPVPQPGMGLR